MLREILEDSPIAYVLIEFQEDTNNEYMSFNTLDMNRSCERMFKINRELNINRIRIVKEETNEEERIEWENMYKNAYKNKKSTKTLYISKINLHCHVEIYCETKTKYHISITKICKGVMELSSALKNSPCIAWIKDVNGVYVDINHAFEDHLNLNREEIIGKTDYDIRKIDIANELRMQDIEVMKSRKLTKYENLLYINNKRVYAECHKWPYTGQNNENVLGSIGIAIITTDKDSLRENIEKNEKVFKEIANTIEEVIFIRDEKKAIYISPAFERIYGVSPEELNLYEDINNWAKHWDNIEYEHEVLDYNTKETIKNTHRLSKNGQEDIWLMSSFAPIFDENGKILKKVGIITDITEKKRKEEEVDNIKMDFFANISHELRTPINLVLSSLQVLDLRNKSLTDENKEFYSKYHSIIGQNGLRLLKLVNNLIDTTRLDSGNFLYCPQNKNIISCVEDICTSVVDFVENNNMKIIFDTNVEEKIIAFDEDNIERIMLNLLSNAVKFNSNNGLIEVNITCGENVVISIKDEGIGIPKDKLDNIFGRFEQVKSNSKKERQGSGIGLSLVRSLVYMHSGDIKVESEVGKGTEFIITLPDKLVKEQTDECVELIRIRDKNNNMQMEFSDI